MNAWRALFSAATSSGLLPWILLAVFAGITAAAGAGFAAGHRWATRTCESEKLDSQLAAAAHEAAAVAKAQATSDKLWSIDITLKTDLAVTRARQTVVVREVTRDVDAHPDLLRCVVPAGTQRLRDEQVSDSQRIAEGHPVQR